MPRSWRNSTDPPTTPIASRTTAAMANKMMVFDVFLFCGITGSKGWKRGAWRGKSGDCFLAEAEGRVISEPCNSAAKASTGSSESPAGTSASGVIFGKGAGADLISTPDTEIFGTG